MATTNESFSVEKGVNNAVAFSERNGVGQKVEEAIGFVIRGWSIESEFADIPLSDGAGGVGLTDVLDLLAGAELIGHG